MLTRAGFERFVSSLPAVEIVHQWGDASVAKVGGKIFALLSGWSTGGDVGLSFKCSDMSFDLLPDLDGVRPAPYLARAKWVQIIAGSALGEDELRNYVREAHRLVASKLPKRQREALGLGPIAAAPQTP
ncbi:MmcQ/YjbR family DNA-binding protein [Devosia sp. FKR38]|uniref:MmcQ/YjbR family DNA-binding protein n=1 Tax=Devosia sp. FKR38 TaxID=2562312 RepID=UPI0010BF6FEF|nr:MmcQ/YjbR family DNA-binding protein [Devosia sp. FKR38]